MKITLLLFLLISGTYYSQEITKVRCLSKKTKCWITAKDEFYGLMKGDLVLEEPKFTDYNAYNGIVSLSNEFGSVCYNDQGKKMIDLPHGEIEIGEFDHLIVAMLEGRSTVFTYSGIQLVPYGNNSYDTYEMAVIVKNEDTGERGLFNYNGETIVPFSKKDIYYEDYDERILAVKYDSTFTVHLDEKHELPPNCSILDELNFVSDREVSVGEYMNFLGSQKAEGILSDAYGQHTIEVTTLFPDTTKVEKKLLPLYRYAFGILTLDDQDDYNSVTLELATTIGDIYTPLEFDKKLSPLLNFPVTGITKWQAEQYCAWLQYQYQMHESDDYAAMISFQLPTEEQWEKLAQQALRPENVSKQAPDSLNKENCMLVIYNSLVQCKNYASYLKGSLGGGSVSVKSPILDMEGRSHVYGNVAEMTKSEGVAKGGSYYHPAAEATVRNVMPYSDPEPWLGFRIVGQYKIW